MGLSESVAFELSPVAVWDKVFQETMVKGKGIGTGTCGECQGVIRCSAMRAEESVGNEVI